MVIAFDSIPNHTVCFGKVHLEYYLLEHLVDYVDFFCASVIETSFPFPNLFVTSKVCQGSIKKRYVLKNKICRNFIYLLKEFV